MENSQQVQVNFCFRPNPRWRVRNIQWLIISHKSTWIGASDNVVQWNHVARSKSVTPTSRDAHNLCSYGDGHQPWQHGAISNLPKFISSATRCWKHRLWPSPWAPITPNQNLNTKNMMFFRKNVPPIPPTVSHMSDVRLPKQRVLHPWWGQGYACSYKGGLERQLHSHSVACYQCKLLISLDFATFTAAMVFD